MSWGFRFWLKLALGIWVLAFILLVIPVTMLHTWKVGTLPVVEGALSNHHTVEVKNRKTGRIERSVKATLEFDRPGDNAPVHCKHDDVTIGPAGKPESFVTRVEIAARTDSCHGYSFLPLNTPTVTEWVWIFLFIGFVLIIFVGITYYGDRIERFRTARRRRAEGKPPSAS